MKNKILARMLALAVAGLLIGVSPAAAQSTVVLFDPLSSTMSVGQVATVNVRIDSVTDLFGHEFVVSYDPAILEVQDANPNKAGVQVALGTFLKPDYEARNEVDVAQGKIRVTVVQTQPNPPVSGTGVLATITFRALAGGTSNLTFDTVNLSTANGTPISRELQNGQVIVSGGPTVTPSPTPTPGPTATPGPTVTPGPTPAGGILGYHTVRYRETLFCIGRAYAVSPWAIATQNNLAYPYRLSIGRQLAIPNVPWKITPGPVCPRQFGGTTPPPPGCRTRHVVRWGETLYSIAWRYGTTVWAIASANHLPNPNCIFAGQSLCIP